MISYRPGNPQASLYGLSYRELRDDYWHFRSMTNEEFVTSAFDALHFAVFVCWIKETGSDVMCDIGVVHELIHLLGEQTRDDAIAELARIRMDFNQVCELA